MAKKISTMTEAQAKAALKILGVDLRGKFGGPDSPFGDFVASHGKYGPYFRRRVIPRDPESPAQLAQRRALKGVCQAWAGLTPEARESWINIRLAKTSKFGDYVRLTGQNAWLHVNTMRQRIGLPLVVLPPTGKNAVTFTLPAVRLIAPTTLKLRFGADTWNAPGGGIIVSGSPPPGFKVDSWNTYNAIATFVHPGTGELTVEYPSAVVEGDRVRLRLHASAPSGRQSMVVFQYVIAES